MPDRDANRRGSEAPRESFPTLAFPYKVRITVNGDRGTLYFECHFLDLETHKVAAVTEADQDVARIGGRWLITNMVGGTATLRP